MEGSQSLKVSAGKSVHKRSATACLRCRSRKVRCDLIVQGSSCTNCRLDMQECVVKVNKRHRHISSLAGNLDLLSRNELISAEGQNHGSQLIYQIRDQRPASPPNDELFEHTPNQRLAVNSADDPLSVSDASKSESIAPDSLDIFKSPPSNMEAEDVKYLKLKGAFSIPSEGLRCQLLQSYLNFVHPYNPVLDIQDIHAMEGHSDTSHVSYLLFQAVMLGGSLFVEQKHLAKGGYSTRKAARQVFYDRARVLYERDYEQDRFVIVQALLLMSLWYEAPKSHKDCWHWSGLAIGLIKSTDINNFRDGAENEKKKIEKWRRLWWSGFVRDRLIALGMKLPIRLKCEDSSKVKTLERDDFGLDEWQHNLLQASENCSLSWNTERGHLLSTMYIEEVKLCICIDRFLYVLREERRSFESVAGELQLSENGLNDWLSNLPHKAKLDLKSTSEMDPVLTVHQAVLRMVHLCAFTFVQRAYLTILVPRSQASEPRDPEMQITARAKIRSAAGTMAAIAQYLRAKGLVQYLPHSAVISFIHVNLIYLIELTSINEIDGICQSMRTMEIFRDSYFDTDYGTRLVKTVFERESMQNMPIDNEPNAPDRDIPKPVISSLQVPMLGNEPAPNDLSFDDSPSHEWIVEEFTAFINSTGPTWDAWQQEISDSSIPSQLEGYQPDTFPTEMAEGDPLIGTADSPEHDSLIVARASEHSQAISQSGREGYGIEQSMDWQANTWPIDSDLKDAEFNYEVDF